MSENETKQQLELVVSEGFEAQLPKEIPCNIEEIIKALDEEILPKYLSRVYSDDQLSEARADHATLKKWIDAVDAARKQYEKIYMKPFTEFKGKIKLATDRVQTAMGKVNEQITAIEGKTKSRNKDFCEAYFVSVVGDLNGLIVYEQIEDPKWYNLSVKDTERKKAIDEKLAKIRNDLKLIDYYAKQDENMELVRVFYLRNFDLSGAVAAVNEINDDRDRISAVLRANRPVETNREQGRAETRAEGETALKPNDEAIFTIRFEVDGTEKELAALKKFLKENGIEYKAIK